MGFEAHEPKLESPVLHVLNWAGSVTSLSIIALIFKMGKDFSGSLGVKSRPASTGHTGLIPGLGRFHTLQGS